MKLENRIHFLKMLRNRKGQTLVEYALILVLIALGVTVAMTTLKNNIGNAYNNASTQLTNG